jgi:transcriptional regulator with XRE-family HTH domain
MLQFSAPDPFDQEMPMAKAAGKTASPRRTSRVTATATQAAMPTLQQAGGAAVRTLARQLHSWTGTLLGGVGTAADMSLALAAASVQRPGPKAAVAKAAALVRDAREAAGLTLDDLGAALDLKDPTFMALVESGKVGLPFDMILRLATILGRNDPVTFILQLTRSYNPRVWKSLEALGIGKLLLQAGREREFANIYRSNTVARQLSDKDFAAALAFSAAAFESALVFLGHAKKPDAPKAEPAKAAA